MSHRVRLEARHWDLAWEERLRNVWARAVVINDSVHTISPLSFQNALYLLACCGLGLAVVVTDMVAMLVVAMTVTIILEF